MNGREKEQIISISDGIIEARNEDGYPYYRGVILARLPLHIRKAAIKAAVAVKEASESTRYLLVITETTETDAIKSRWEREYGNNVDAVFQTQGGKYMSSSHRIVHQDGSIKIYDFSLEGENPMLPKDHTHTNLREKVGQSLGFDMNDLKDIVPLIRFGSGVSDSIRHRTCFMKVKR